MKPASLTYPLHFFGLILLTTIVAQADSAFAQASNIVPDNTLGTESSVVNPRDANSESIDGGAVRGQNLFHSFEEFNVDAGRGVYFANPNDVTNIFSRVTGNNVSNILGTLGVDGAANLYLINPNGIVFGEGASLDVQGSFTATTADGIEFGEQGSFDAINPQIPQLLTINPSAYLFNQIENQAVNDI
ncbi:MAG: filamentous hemagglutinin N-terminal domain-containing protein, partial [Waterburya sp.]